MCAVRILLGAALVSLSALACSSVPDVTYADEDAGAADTGADTGTSSGNDPEAYSCPDNPPPQGKGICCGSRLCLNCSSNHCSWCEREDCSRPEVCCARSGSGGQNGGNGNGNGGPNGVDCRQPSSC